MNTHFNGGTGVEKLFTFQFFIELHLFFCFLSVLQFRGKVAGALSELPVKDFDGVAMKGEALNSLTQATGEIDEDAQVDKHISHTYFYLEKSRFKSILSALFLKTDTA